MPATIATARDDILARFTAQWNANSPAVNGGTAPLVFYDGVGQEGPKPHDAAWVRVSIRHATGEDTGIGGGAGARLRTTKTGVVTVQVFTPLETGLGLQLNEDLSQVAKDAFEKHTTTNGVIFRNVRAQEVGPSDAWFTTNVISEWTYDEFVG